MKTNIETIRTEKIDTLNDLIEITRDSATFYGDAAKAVPNPALKSLFGEMASSKNGLVGAMSKEVLSSLRPPAACVASGTRCMAKSAPSLAIPTMVT